MQKVFVIIVALIFYCRVLSTLANNVTQDGEDGNNFPTLPTFPSLPTMNGDAWNNSVQNITSLLYDSCNITSCNPVNYKHCYDDKAVQLVIHAIAVLLGIVSAFFGKHGCVYAAVMH